jgi:HNH endonuclease
MRPRLPVQIVCAVCGMSAEVLPRKGRALQLTCSRTCANRRTVKIRKAMKREPAEKRFLGLISPEPNTGCWLWSGHTNRKGYAEFNFGGSGNNGLAHRWAHEHFVGPIPEGHTIDHLCRMRSCVNPGHLEAVIHAENIRRARPYREGMRRAG